LPKSKFGYYPRASPDTWLFRKPKLLEIRKRKIQKVSNIAHIDFKYKSFADFYIKLN
jgi:hypothetical protein